MKKKLTLTIEESVTEQAKRVAKREGTSVSEMVEEYLIRKTSEKTDWEPEEGSWTDKMLGSVRLSEDVEDYKEIKEREIRKKYGG